MGFFVPREEVVQVLPVEDISLLKQALPYIKQYRNKIFVIKFGGEVVSDAARMDSLAEDISLLHELNIRIVPGGSGTTYTLPEGKSFVIGSLGDGTHPRQLRIRIRENNEVLKAFGARPLSFKQVLADYNAAARVLKPFVTNTVVYVHEAIRSGKHILFEGTQGTFLDLDHGTYPYVTSSNTTDPFRSPR